MRTWLTVLAIVLALPLGARAQGHEGREVGPLEHTATGAGHGGGSPCLPEPKPESSVELPSADGLQVAGSLDPRVIIWVVHRNRMQLRYCQERELGQFHPVVGHLVVAFAISDQGKVTSAKVTSSTTKNDALDTCVAQRFRSWSYPKPKSGAPVKVEFPFDLKTPPSG